MISIKYQRNIDLGDGNSKKNSNSLVLIYKNLLSDMRIYFNDEFTTFLENHQLDVKNNLVILPLYPILIYQFLKQRFDDYLIEMVCPGNRMKVYFYIAAFL